MSRVEKIAKNYKYDGLGFTVILESVLLHKVRGEWVPKIDLEELADAVFKVIPSKASKLTGDEIQFIRTYLGKSKSAFGEIFKLSHTAIAKWEAVGDAPAPITASQEIVLRLYLEDYLNVGHREFYKAYKSFESSVYVVDSTPLKIAI